MYRQALLASAFSLLLASAVQVRAGEVARWNVIATDAALAEQLDPLTESRIFAIVHASIHDALNAIERRYEPYKAASARRRTPRPTPPWPQLRTPRSSS